MRERVASAAICGLVAAVLTAAFATPALAQDDLCGRPREAPEALYDRLTKTEKLKESFRDKAYIAINDAARNTLWTFTVPGHPAHPTVVCRQPVDVPGKELSLQMDVQCNADGAECERLVSAFQELNQRMLRDAKKQQKR
jgi:hypothetical protein